MVGRRCKGENLANLDTRLSSKCLRRLLMKHQPLGSLSRCPFHERFYACIKFSNPIGIPIYFWSIKMLTTNFCTSHDSYAVVACAKICGDLTARNWDNGRYFFVGFKFVSEKSLVRWAPGLWGKRVSKEFRPMCFVVIQWILNYDNYNSLSLFLEMCFNA